MQNDISYSRIWKIAYPIILGSIAQNLINFTDTAFLGRVGEVALGGGALGGILYLAVFMLGLGFGMGEQILIARRLGEGNKKAIGQLFHHSLFFLLFMAVLAFLFLKFGSSLIVGFGVDSPEIRKATMEFLDFRAFGIFFAFVNVVYRALYVGLARTKVITYTTFVLAVVNIIFDYLLIFGHFGFPEMGIAGAALASVIAEFSAMVYFMVYTRYFLDRPSFGLYTDFRFDRERMKRILKVAGPTMIQQFTSLFVWFIFFLYVEKLGKGPLAVSNIIRSVYVLLMMPIWGFATAANTLVSFLIGQQRSSDVMRLLFRIGVLSFSSVLLMVSAGLIFPDAVLSIYTNNHDLIVMGVPVLKVISVGALLLSVAFVFFSGVSGTGKTNISLRIELFVLFLYLVYTHLMVEVFHRSVEWVWTAEWLYGTLMVVLSLLYLRTGRWKAHQI
ncbi:MAG: MATE family efflux transporter [Bacteroidales bacterium]|nr:MATE family efflux transporter [Bacteroidales bacterium]